MVKLLIIGIGLLSQLYAHDYYLHGQVITYSKDGIPSPLKQGIISIEGTGNTVTYEIKNSEGRFHLDLAPRGKLLIKEGEKVRLHMDISDKWFMLTPYNREFFLPKNSKNHDIDVILLGNKSKLKIKNFTINLDNGKKEKVEDCVQILSVKSLWSAEKIRDEFNRKWKKRYKAYIEIVKLNGKKNYKVLVSVMPYSKLNIKKAYTNIKRVKAYEDAFIRRTIR